MRPTIVVPFNDTPEACDGLALGGLLAEAMGAGVLVVPVLRDTTSTETTERAIQRAVHERLAAIRASAAAVLPGRDFELWPVFHMPVAAAVHALALEREALLIAFGATHHRVLGRLLLGGSAADAVRGAPCPIAVAPRGFRRHAALAPPVVGAAFDGSPQAWTALRLAQRVAAAQDAPLRVISVTPSGWARPVAGPAPTRAALDDACAGLGASARVEPILLHGRPEALLASESAGLGLLACGSRGHGPLARAALGSVSTALMDSATCPLVVAGPALPAAAPVARTAAASH